MTRPTTHMQDGPRFGDGLSPVNPFNHPRGEIACALKIPKLLVPFGVISDASSGRACSAAPRSAIPILKLLALAPPAYNTEPSSGRAWCVATARPAIPIPASPGSCDHGRLSVGGRLMAAVRPLWTFRLPVNCRGPKPLPAFSNLNQFSHAASPENNLTTRTFQIGREFVRGQRNSFRAERKSVRESVSQR